MAIPAKLRPSKKIANITPRARFALHHALRAQQKARKALEKAKDSSHPAIRNKWLNTSARAKKAKLRLIQAARQSLCQANSALRKQKKNKK